MSVCVRLVDLCVGVPVFGSGGAELRLQPSSQSFSGHCLAEQPSDIMAAAVHRVLAYTDYKQAIKR